MRILKLTIGAAVAIIIAYFLGLTNPLTAGTIVLLSLGKTRRSSLQTAFVRVKALGLTLVFASIVFFTTGFNIISFVLFLCLYIPLILILKLDEGLIIGAVTAGQILAQQLITIPILINSISLFAIGVMIAFLLNLYMPNLSKHILNDQRYIESTFRDILLTISTILKGDDNFNTTIFDNTEVFINKAIKQAKVNEENFIFVDVTYYGKYIRMRKRQFYILKHMFELALRVDMNLDIATEVAKIVESLAYSLSEFGDGEQTLKILSNFSELCQKGELPKSRAEFENRAVLFQILSEMRHFIELKRDFSNEYGRQK